MAYPEMLIAAMRQDLTKYGVEEARTPSEVDAALSPNSGTVLMIVNSVCGCAAGGARPAVAIALKGPAKPDAVVTVFAGQDTDATARARAQMGEYPPSSPSFALWKDGKVVHFVPRHQIEGRPPQVIALDLVSAFEKHCAKAKSA